MLVKTLDEYMRESRQREGAKLHSIHDRLLSQVRRCRVRLSRLRQRYPRLWMKTDY